MQPTRYPYHHPQAISNRTSRIGGRRAIALVVGVLITLLLIGTIAGRTVAALPQVQSGVTGYCLTTHESGSGPGIVDTQQCNDGESQEWTAGLMSIQYAGNKCLEVSGSKVEVNACKGGPEQVWLRDKDGFINPNSQLCLSLPNGKTGEPLVVASCDLLSRASEQWYAVNPGAKTAAALCPEAKGKRIACYAIQEWAKWQADPANRNTLLDTYTDGTPYEEWCADFVSYVYKEAGYPFTAGIDGWDINEANDIQNQDFTQHDPADYTPEPGDIAYFNYDGGHVEIVVVGGKHPTFVYGNSGDIDPITGNGTMKANTITDDGDNGHLVYYLSPNRS